MTNGFYKELEDSMSMADIFELVKEAMRKTTGRSRAGLMLGLQELGADMRGFIGAYYPINSNIIVLNKTPLRRIKETDPGLYKPYSFHVLLHEYIHSLGIINEDLTKRKTYEVSREAFGDEHIVTEFAVDMNKFLPNLVYPTLGYQPVYNAPIEIIKNFARSDTNYIA